VCPKLFLKVVNICCVVQQVLYNFSSRWYCMDHHEFQPQFYSPHCWAKIKLNAIHIWSLLKPFVLLPKSHCWNLLCYYLKAIVETSYVITWKPLFETWNLLWSYLKALPQLKCWTLSRAHMCSKVHSNYKLAISKFGTWHCS
jgi:hypothetical protein